MRQIIMRQFTITCLVLAFAVFLGSLVISAFFWFAVPTPDVRIAATAIMIVTLALQLAFVLTQLITEGRQLVNVRFARPDAWLTIITFTTMPGVAWHHLAPLAAPFMQGILTGYATPALNAVLLVIGRLIQQRNYRHLVDGSAPPLA